MRTIACLSVLVCLSLFPACGGPSEGGGDDDDYACELVCKGGNDACGDVQMDCGDSGSCSIDCANDACWGVQVDCGAGSCSAQCQGQPPPTLNNCDASCACSPC